MPSRGALQGPILIVDDHAETRDTLTENLGGAGYLVACASNGREALDQLRAEVLPSLILLDLFMPVVDGMEFRRQQLQHSALAAIPVVVMTGCETVVNVPNAAAGYLMKPFDVDVVLAVVERTTAGAPCERSEG
jgi:two-component system, OmpR family, response regulator CpxR